MRQALRRILIALVPVLILAAMSAAPASAQEFCSDTCDKNISPCDLECTVCKPPYSPDGYCTNGTKVITCGAYGNKCKPCQPQACGNRCGLVGDGCGGEIDCGSCDICVPKTCGNRCGLVSDGCNPTPIDCGPCCQPTGCAGRCGVVDDCGVTLDCGSCPGACGKPRFQVSNENPAIGQQVVFRADPTSIDDPSPLWNFGERPPPSANDTAIGTTAVHSYRRAGGYPVRLTAKDPICHTPQTSDPVWVGVCGKVDCEGECGPVEDGCGNITDCGACPPAPPCDPTQGPCKIKPNPIVTCASGKHCDAGCAYTPDLWISKITPMRGEAVTFRAVPELIDHAPAPQWRVDGAVVGHGLDLEHVFDVAGHHQLQLSGEDSLCHTPQSSQKKAICVRRSCDGICGRSIDDGCTSTPVVCPPCAPEPPECCPVGKVCPRTPDGQDLPRCTPDVVRDRARAVSAQVPDSLKCLEVGRATVTMHNSGLNPWTATDGYALVADFDSLGVSRVPIRDGDRVEPGHDYTFTFDVRAPIVTTVGARALWRMSNASGAFGETIATTLWARAGPDCREPVDPGVIHCSVEVKDGYGRPRNVGGLPILFEGFADDFEERATLIEERDGTTDPDGRQTLKITRTPAINHIRCEVMVEGIKTVSVARIKPLPNNPRPLPLGVRAIVRATRAPDPDVQERFHGLKDAPAACRPARSTNEAVASLYYGKGRTYDKVVVLAEPFDPTERVTGFRTDAALWFAYDQLMPMLHDAGFAVWLVRTPCTGQNIHEQAAEYAQAVQFASTYNGGPPGGKLILAGYSGGGVTLRIATARWQADPAWRAALGLADELPASLLMFGDAPLRGANVNADMQDFLWKYNQPGFGNFNSCAFQQVVAESSVGHFGCTGGPTAPARCNYVNFFTTGNPVRFPDKGHAICDRITEGSCECSGGSLPDLPVFTINGDGWAHGVKKIAFSQGACDEPQHCYGDDKDFNYGGSNMCVDRPQPRRLQAGDPFLKVSIDNCPDIIGRVFRLTEADIQPGGRQSAVLSRSVDLTDFKSRAAAAVAQKLGPISPIALFALKLPALFFCTAIDVRQFATTTFMPITTTLATDDCHTEGPFDEVAMEDFNMAHGRISKKILNFIKREFEAAASSPTNPTAHASIDGPAEATAGMVVQLSGNGSTPSNGAQITTYIWEMGDGSVQTGPTVQHDYAVAGRYTVGLTVVDSNGLVSTDASSMAVRSPEPGAPAVTAGGPYAGAAGRPIPFAGHATPGFAAIASEQWSFGDGATASGAAATHTYASVGRYLATLSVTDTQGLTASSATVVTVSAPASNRLPVGNLDGVSLEGIARGWTLDPDAPGQALAVHFYADGPAGHGQLVRATSANQPRPDVNQVTGYAGNHGFELALPTSLRDGQPHSLYVYAIDSAGGANPLLAGAPLSFTLAPRLPIGWHHPADCEAHLGWTCDADDFTQPLQVHFYDGLAGQGGTYIGQVTADRPREPAVGELCGGSANHGFQFATPSSLRDDRPHTIYAYAINVGGSGGNPLLSGSPKTLQCASNRAPIGHLDAVTPLGVAAGWTLDPDAPAQTLGVHFYADGPAGEGQLVGSAPADKPRLGVHEGNHGFELTLPSSLLDGRAHTLFVYAIDSAGGTNPLLPGSPLSFTLTSHPPVGWHDAADCQSSWGWVCDADDFSQPLQVHFYDGPAGQSPALGAVVANLPRGAGVVQLCGGNANHGFRFPTPPSLLDSRPHTLHAYALNIGVGGNPLVPGSPRTLRCARDGVAVEPVVWRNAVNVAFDETHLTNAGPAGWVSGAVSTRSIVDGFVEFGSAETDKGKVCGLSNGDSDQRPDDVDFAIKLDAAGQVQAREGGTVVAIGGSYIPGDRFRVEVVAGTVRYWKNGVVFHTSTLAPRLPLLVDTSLNQTGATLDNVVVGALELHTQWSPPARAGD